MYSVSAAKHVARNAFANFQNCVHAKKVSNLLAPRG